MNEIPNEPNGPGEFNDSAKQETHETTDPQSPGQDPHTNPNRRLVDAVRSAFKKGAHDARNAAREAGPKAKSIAAQAAYGVSYGIAFGAVFSGAFVQQLAPDCMRAGWTDGKKEGRESATQTAENLKTEPLPPIVEPGTGS